MAGFVAQLVCVLLALVRSVVLAIYTAVVVDCFDNFVSRKYSAKYFACTVVVCTVLAARCEFLSAVIREPIDR